MNKCEEIWENPQERDTLEGEGEYGILYMHAHAHVVQPFTSVCLTPVTCWSGGNNQSGWNLCPL